MKKETVIEFINELQKDYFWFGEMRMKYNKLQQEHDKFN